MKRKLALLLAGIITVSISPLTIHAESIDIDALKQFVVNDLTPAIQSASAVLGAYQTNMANSKTEEEKSVALEQFAASFKALNPLDSDKILSLKTQSENLGADLLQAGSFDASNVDTSLSIDNENIVEGYCFVTISSTVNGFKLFINDVECLADRPIYLLPGVYEVRATKEGYSDWIKIIEVDDTDINVEISFE